MLAFDQLAAEADPHPGRRRHLSRRSAVDDGEPPAAAAAPGVRHPALSRRGAALASTPRASTKLGGPARPFRLGTPALTAPVHAGTRLAMRRLKAMSLAQLDYAHPPGLLALRQQIAERVRRVRGASCSADQVVVVTGAQHGLSMMCQVLLDPGDTAWLESRLYRRPGGAHRCRGAHRADPGRWRRPRCRRRHPPGAPRRLACVTPAHQFPLAVPMAHDRRLALLAWARRARAWILEDDYDCGFHYGSRPTPCLQSLDADGRVIYIGSFSKTVFPAMRLGFVIVPPDLRDAMAGVRRASTIHSPVLEQGVMADLMASGAFERHLLRMRQEYRRRYDALSASAARHGRGLLTLRPLTTGLHAVADVSAPTTKRVPQGEGARHRSHADVVLLHRPAASTARRSAAGVRLIRTQRFDAGMAALAAAIKAARRVRRTG